MRNDTILKITNGLRQSSTYKGAAMMASGDIYSIGLVMIGLAVLIAAVALPVFLTTGSKLRKQLESEYGKHNRHGKR